MFPTKEFKPLALIVVVVAMLVFAFLGVQLYRAHRLPVVQRNMDTASALTSRVQYPSAFPPVHITTPSPSIFAPTPYTAGRPSDIASQAFYINAPRPYVIPVPPEVYKALRDGSYGAPPII